MVTWQCSSVDSVKNIDAVVDAIVTVINDVVVVTAAIAHQYDIM